MKNNESENNRNDIVVRLNAIIALLSRLNFSKDGKLQLGEAITFLKNIGLSPTEIANIFGKKNATEISTFLYPKKK